MVDAAHADLSWHAFAALDAATRMLDSIVRSGGLRPGQQAARVLKACFEQARRERPGEGKTIPNAYWSVRPAPPGPDGEEQLLFQGAVLVRVTRAAPSKPGPPRRRGIQQHRQSDPPRPRAGRGA